MSNLIEKAKGYAKEVAVVAGGIALFEVARRIRG